MQRRAAAVVLGAVAIGALAIGWLQAGPQVSRAGAVEAARTAFDEAGLAAHVEPHPDRATYRSPSSDTVDVWTVHATVRSEPIELRLTLADALPVSIDDRTAAGTTYILSEEEYEQVAESFGDLAQARALRRNLWLTAAGLLVVGLAFAHGVAASRTEEGAR